MKTENCKEQSASRIASCLLLILSLAGCGGGGGSSQVIEGPPATPSGVKVVISASNELTISWNGVANAASYNIYWSTSPGVSKNSTKLSCVTSTNCVCSTSTNCVHKGLVSGSTYFYVVTAVNSYGESSVSAEVFALLDTPRPPGAVAAVAGDGQATVSWNTNGAVSYNVYMASQPGVTKANAAMSHTDASNPFIHTGLTNGTTYYFVVTSVNSFGESIESSEVAVTPTASGSLAVSGVVKYEDKEYGTGGFTGKTYYKAVRYAEVEAVDSASGLTVATGTTDPAGLYNLTLLPADSGKTIYIRVISSVLSPSIGVKDLSNALHAVAGANFVASGTATANISIPTTSPAAGAFNILDVYTSGAQFVQSLSGSYPPALKAFWQTGNANGTYYCSAYDSYWCTGGEGIYILNDSGDTDEYDDDVLWHEYGHFIANHFSKDDSQGGVHYLNSNDLDLRLTWSEGWGDFFPPSVKAWLATLPSPSLLSTAPAMASSLYVDTSGGNGWSFDFGNPNGPEYFYASNEAAVAKVLIGLRTDYGMQAVWDTFTSSSVKTATMPVNLEVFWDAWNLLFPTNDITATLAERAIAYSADIHEAASDNTANASRKAVVNGLAEDHTLYGSGDVDYIAFDATINQPFTVKTLALKNGADTFISIIAPDFTVAASNDNSNGASYANGVPNNCDMNGECHENGFDILGSTKSFTAAATGTYYVEVKSSPNRPLSAGRYGGYSLTITSP